ncbi:MAG: FAD-dependent oxidoreductase [Bacillota bacterium]
MSFLKDILPIFNSYPLPLIEHKEEREGIHSFIFDAKQMKPWKAGQHGIFSITHKKIHKPLRPFSVASAYQEHTVMVTMKIPNTPSAFKQAMLELTPGMTIKMRGPVGPLYIRKDAPTLLIAGGIGITPHRAILKDIIDNNTVTHPVILLYIANKDQHIYNDVLNEASHHKNIVINRLTDKTFLAKNIDDFLSTHPDAQVFLSGPKAMVKSFYKTLKKQGVKSKNIYKDTFYGY